MMLGRVAICGETDAQFHRICIFVVGALFSDSPIVGSIRLFEALVTLDTQGMETTQMKPKLGKLMKIEMKPQGSLGFELLITR